MKLTNKNNFPEALVRAVENDPYNRGDSDYSVTQLLKPPRQVALERLYGADLTEDVEDRLWSLYGQVVHTILERANEADLVEKRFKATFNTKYGPKTVSGQVDNHSLVYGLLTDWKFTSSWGFKLGQPVDPSWVAQLNMLAEILTENQITVESLRIVGLLRDWSKLEAKRTADYPKKGVITVPIERWSREQARSFIELRLNLHEDAKNAAEHELPHCSPDERWAKPDIWAVMKGQTAMRGGLCLTEEIAKNLSDRNPGTRIQFRPGVSTKCENYCKVSEVCSQFKKMKGDS